MAFIRQIEPGEAEGALEKIYGAASSRAGGVAHIIKVMGLEPRVCGASMQFYVALMKSENSLSGARREMIAAVVSNLNDCYY